MKTTTLTTLECPEESTLKRTAVSTDHNTTVLSIPADANTDVDGEKARAVTAPSCPTNVAVVFPVESKCRNTAPPAPPLAKTMSVPDLDRAHARANTPPPT